MKFSYIGIRYVIEEIVNREMWPNQLSASMAVPCGVRRALFKATQ